MAFLDWQMVLILLSLFIAVVAIFIGLENQRKIKDSFQKIEECIEERIGEGKEKSSFPSKEEKLSSAQALIQKQHDQLLQHIISLSRLAFEKNKEEKGGEESKHPAELKIQDKIAEEFARKVLEEIRKKW